MLALVYADRPLSVGMAVPLMGVQAAKVVQKGGSAGFNWLVMTQVNRGTSTSIMQDIRELLPEELAHALHDAIPDDRKNLPLPEAIDKMQAVDENRLLPGTPISIKGVLRIDEVSDLAPFDPFNPPKISLPLFSFHGEECFVGRLESNGYAIPVYFASEARAQVAYCHENPVELTGVLRWCPPYRPKGAAVLQLALRVAAVWLD